MASTPNEFIEFYAPGNVPGTPDAGKYRLYLKADGTQLLLKDSTGAVIALVNTAPVATTVAAVGALAALDATVDPADTPADADALRDDLVANTLPALAARDDALKTDVDTLQAKVDELRTVLRAAGLMA